jgi:hypothetical protein
MLKICSIDLQYITDTTCMLIIVGYRRIYCLSYRRLFVGGGTKNGKIFNYIDGILLNYLVYLGFVLYTFERMCKVT